MMPSPGTFKSLSKALDTHASTLAVPLPEDLTEVVESYLDKHEKYDDSSSEKLQDELLSVYNKNVVDHPERLPGFVALLSQLLPAIRSPSRIFQWWDLLQDGYGDALLNEKGLMSESFSGLLNILSQEDLYLDEGGSVPAVNLFVERLISMWMENWQGPSLRGPADHVEKVVREALLVYGKRKPKDFLTILDTFFVQAEFRVITATLLCEFIQAQPPHLYQVLDTPLFNNLLRCLQLDTSTTVVSLTVTALTMLMPHSPSSMVPHLPTLFNIYARLLFWHRQYSEPADNEQAVPRPLVDSTSWEGCNFSSDFDDHDIPSLRNYFTVLYGLYPINLMDYIRKPHRYLRHANDPNADFVEVQPSEIRHKSEEFQRCHLLHPNFFHLTVESEKTDHGRWQASEPAEVVAECTALCVVETQRGPERPEYVVEPTQRRSSLFSKDESTSSLRDFPLLRVVPTDGGANSSERSNRDSVDTHSRGAEGDSPTFAPHPVVSPSETQLQDLIHSNKVIKSGLNQPLTSESVPSLSLSQQESTAEGAVGTTAQPESRPRAASSLSTTDANSRISQLQGQVLLLQNDLSFERHLKQQHMAHMGELRRRELKEAASEAEMQNLIIANRNLKSRAEEAKKAEMQSKKEAEKRSGLAKKWEADLSAKLKMLREDAKKTKTHVEELERELAKSRAECEELKSRLCAFEVRELNWEQNVQSHEVDKSEMDRLRSELGRLTATERAFEARDADTKQALETAAGAENQIPALNAKLEAQGLELERTKEAYEAQLAILRAKVSAREQDANNERLSASANRAVEGALAASRAKQVELQKQHDLLLRKYAALQSSLFDMQCGSSPNASQSSGGDDQGQGTPGSSSPTQARAAPQRAFKSPEGFDASAYNGTPSLIARSGSASAGPSESSASLPSATTTPEPRSQGRGGVGSRIRKEAKEGKEKKEGEKKEKKMGGIRGMKNFHVV